VRIAAKGIDVVECLGGSDVGNWGGVNPEETLVGILDGNRVGVFWGVTVSDVNYYRTRLETDLLAECFKSDHENGYRLPSSASIFPKTNPPPW
jgi:hypothetical protein